MNYSQTSKYILLSVLLLHSTSVHSYDWSCFSWTNVYATISALSYKVKVALLLTTAAITGLLYKNKKPFSSRKRNLARSTIIHLNIDPQKNEKADTEHLRAEQKILHGSEAIVRAMLRDLPSEDIIPLIEATTKEALNTQVCRGRLALVCACSERRFDIVQALVKQGADINLPDEDNWTPLYTSLLAYQGTWDKPLIKFLLENGADPKDYEADVPGVNDLLIDYRKRRFKAKCKKQAEVNIRRNIRRRSIEGGPCTSLMKSRITNVHQENRHNHDNR